jgi:hypothetical protein
MGKETPIGCSGMLIVAIRWMIIIYVMREFALKFSVIGLSGLSCIN